MKNLQEIEKRLDQLIKEDLNRNLSKKEQKELEQLKKQRNKLLKEK